MKYLGFFYNLTKPITWFLLQPDGRNLSFDLVWIVSVQYKDINSAWLFSFVITLNRHTYSTSKQTYLLYITYQYSSLFKNQITFCMEYIPIELRNILCYFWPQKINISYILETHALFAFYSGPALMSTHHPHITKTHPFIIMRTIFSFIIIIIIIIITLFLYIHKLFYNASFAFFFLFFIRFIIITIILRIYDNICI